MKFDKAHLLEQYIFGKDQDKSHILETIYEKNAEVEFQINAPNITFPNKIAGHRTIAKILSYDFNRKYEKVKTYYLSKNIKDRLKILKQPWLVVMKDIGNDLTRIGSGHYNWEFKENNNELKIHKHKIYIHVMLEIHDPDSAQLQDIQTKLEYPWIETHVALDILKSYKNLTEITKYLMIQNR